MPSSCWLAATSWWCFSTGDAGVAQGLEHVGADVLGGVDRRQGEVAPLGPRPVALVAPLELPAPVVGPLGVVHRVEGVVGLDPEAHVVEQEELRLGTEVGGVADSRELQVGLGVPGRAPGAARVALARGRLVHVADEVQGRVRHERVEPRGGGIREQGHVGLVDALPPVDGGAVEHDAVLERVLVESVGGHGHVVPAPPGVGEAEVDELDVAVADHLEDGVRVCHGPFLSPVSLVKNRPRLRKGAGRSRSLCGTLRTGGAGVNPCREAAPQGGTPRPPASSGTGTACR